MDNILYKYNNGNTTVTIYDDGTKVREYEDIPIIQFPESLDVKITNYCDAGCKYCHESSTIKGKHADLEKLKSILSDLPSGVELAIGGGNCLAHPNLLDFLIWCKDKGFICNITINQFHLAKYNTLITYLIENDLVKGVGISITGNNFEEIKKLKNLTNNIVYHLIIGVHDMNILDELKKLGNCKVLILGYKQFGRGINYYSDEVIKNINTWKIKLPAYFGKFLIAFDNLALKQLDVKSMLPEKVWDSCFMGEDFTFIMYVDGVKEQYAPTSSSSNRTSFSEMTLLDYFVKHKNKISF